MNEQIKLSPKQREVVIRMLQGWDIAKSYETSRDIDTTSPFFEKDSMTSSMLSGLVFSQLEKKNIIKNKVGANYKMGRVTVYMYELSELGKSLYKKYFLCGAEGIIGQEFYGTYEEALKYFKPNEASQTVLSELDIKEALNSNE